MIDLAPLREWMAVARDGDGFEYCCESALENGLDYEALKALLAELERSREVVEAARRIGFAFGGTGKHARQAYRDRWGDFLPQHESLLALDAALLKIDAAVLTP